MLESSPTRFVAFFGADGISQAHHISIIFGRHFFQIRQQFGIFCAQFVIAALIGEQDFELLGVLFI